MYRRAHFLSLYASITLLNGQQYTHGTASFKFLAYPCLRKDYL
jgi:hypothetical protein